VTKLEKLLTSIVKKEGVYFTYDPSLIKVAQKGLKEFNKYYNKIKKNNIY
jgi:hypothetical protein